MHSPYRQEDLQDTFGVLNQFEQRAKEVFHAALDPVYAVKHNKNLLELQNDEEIG